MEMELVLMIMIADDFIKRNAIRLRYKGNIGQDKKIGRHMTK